MEKVKAMHIKSLGQCSLPHLLLSIHPNSFKILKSTFSAKIPKRGEKLTLYILSNMIKPGQRIKNFNFGEIRSFLILIFDK